MTQPPPESPYGNNPNQPGQPNQYGNQPNQYGNQPDQYGNQPNQYGNQQYGGQPQPQKKGLAIAALVLGILGLLTSIFLVGGLLGLLAIILGAVAVIKARKPTHGGKVMAIIGIVLGVLSLIIPVVLIVAGASFLNSETGQDLQSCLQDAGQDQAAQDRCQRELENNLGN